MGETLLLDNPFQNVSTLEPFAGLARMVGSVVRAARENSVVIREQALAECRFLRLAGEWRDQSRFMSSITDMAALPAYHEITAMGAQALPLILRELQRDPNHWFVALAAISGADPVPPQDRGDIEKMSQAWLRWGRDRGYRC
jgi:hypothetical protein